MKDFLRDIAVEGIGGALAIGLAAGAVALCVVLFAHVRRRVQSSDGVKWAALIVATVVAGTVALFAIYTFGWRDDASEIDNERTRAELAAQQVATHCKKDCTVLSVEQVADGLWRSREQHPDGRIFCIAIDLEHFRVASNGETVHGASEVECPN